MYTYIYIERERDQATDREGRDERGKSERERLQLARKLNFSIMLSIILSIIRSIKHNTKDKTKHAKHNP